MLIVFPHLDNWWLVSEDNPISETCYLDLGSVSREPRQLAAHGRPGKLSNVPEHSGRFSVIEQGSRRRQTVSTAALNPCCPWRVTLRAYALFTTPLPARLYENITSSTKPEVHSSLQADSVG